MLNLLGDRFPDHLTLREYSETMMTYQLRGMSAVGPKVPSMDPTRTGLIHAHPRQVYLLHGSAGRRQARTEVVFHLALSSRKEYPHNPTRPGTPASLAEGAQSAPSGEHQSAPALLSLSLSLSPLLLSFGKLESLRKGVHQTITSLRGWLFNEF